MTLVEILVALICFMLFMLSASEAILTGTWTSLAGMMQVETATKA